MLTEKAIQEVKNERTRQNEKWGIQRHSMETWLVILMEEVGEFAQAVQKGDVQSKTTDASDKLNEITQVAAVATAMLEQLIEEEESEEI